MLRIYYTTYEIRRARELINPQSCQNFAMVRNVDENIRHPFWYAKILAVLHINVEVADPTCERQVSLSTRRVDMLWVRRLGGHRWGGWTQNRLDLVGYIDDGSKSGSFGFIDPATVVRGSYLIPAFELGQTKDLLTKSCAWDDEEKGDWVAYYVMR